MDTSNPNPAQLFITADLRPSVVPKFEKFEALPPDASEPRLRSAAEAILGDAMSELGISSGAEALLEERFSPTADVTYTDLEGEAVILNLANGMYYLLNRTGTFIWSLLDGSRSLTEIAELVAAKHSAPLSVVRADLVAFAERLRTQGMIAAGRPA
jgi:hypothetical protein